LLRGLLPATAWLLVLAMLVRRHVASSWACLPLLLPRLLLLLRLPVGQAWLSRWRLRPSMRLLRPALLCLALLLLAVLSQLLLRLDKAREQELHLRECTALPLDLLVQRLLRLGSSRAGQSLLGLGWCCGC
jgi:hypothetical protein